jgi:apolipoprotein N-acyltransferase
MVETIGLSDTLTPAVRLGVWPARLALVFLVCHTAMVFVTYRRRRRRDRAVGATVERGSPA